MTTTKRVALIALVILATAACVIGAGAATLAHSPSQGCSATQPVYSASYKLIGTWQVTLPVGQSVTLPDGDTATCTANSTLVVG